MAGDWIKMRGNLWDDPRVAKIVDLTDSSEAAVIGALYWLWATADQHTEDGILPGLTLRAIDRKTGVKGFADALCAIEWLADHPEGVRIIDFEKHNGSSAKKRCQTAKRVANFAAANAPSPKAKPDTNAASVSSALAREEKRREDKKEDKQPSVVKRASKKCPVDFEVTDDMRTWASLDCPTVDVARATDKFRDYTFKNAITDWVGSWRNWLRRDFESASTTAKSASSETTYQRTMRERVAEISPGLARPAPGQPRQNITDYFQNAPALEMTK